MKDQQEKKNKIEISQQQLVLTTASLKLNDRQDTSTLPRKTVTLHKLQQCLESMDLNYFLNTMDAGLNYKELKVQK